MAIIMGRIICDKKKLKKKQWLTLDENLKKYYCFNEGQYF